MPEQRLILVKKNSQAGQLSGSVVARLDLSSLGKMVKVLSTSINGAKAIDGFIKDNPDNWINDYIERG